MPFIGASALAIARIRPGTRGSVGGWKPSSTPSSRTCIRAGSTPKSLAMSRLDASDGVRMKRACWATCFCIRRKPYQRLQRELAPRVRRRGDVDAPVEGDRVVDRGQERQPHLLDLEHPVAEDLVVVGDVEVVDPVPQQPGDPGAERLGLGEAGHAHGGELLDVDPVPELRELGHPERVRLPVEVQARHLGEGHALVELRVGLAAEHLDGVAERHQLTTEVAQVDALAATVRLGAVRQHRYPHRRGPPSAPDGGPRLVTPDS